MSTIKANDIQNTSGGIPTVKGQRLIPTAWVNFNQTTNVINDSENISSLTDVSVGKTDVNFTIAMNNALYASVVMAIPTVSFSHNVTYCTPSTTSNVRVTHYENTSATDTSAIHIVSFGGQA
tara:strand:+ start:439 stop:804 length:366 start_codon:yes stop_codon:yes gene_type:complete